MHVVTFYSFKGGVGRTMGLVNAALALAQRGRRVLLVDFDLEAPGIDSYIPLEKGAPGLVDYVSEYLTDLVAPSVVPYVQHLSQENGFGNLMVMSAGQQGADYAKRLQQISWRRLYEEQDGYLLFENLRLQWEQEFKPDYVLIDSRTGHTDVGGICTRQLPDAVALFFFPNEQNFSGLTRMASSIRNAKRSPGRSDIVLHCVMSNVPKLDDENSILEGWANRFKQALTTDRVATVHRYDSLDLLNQTLFVNSRPKTSLAKEYQAVADLIVEGNLADRDGALKWLSLLWSRPQRFSPETIEEVARLHPSDSAVQFELGKTWSLLGAEEAALVAFNKAAELGQSSPELLLVRAEAVKKADAGKASEYLRQVLESADVPPHVFSRVIELLLQLDRLSPDMASKPAFLTSVVRPDLLLRSDEGRRLLIALSERRSDSRDPAIALAFMGLRNFKEATLAISGSRAAVSKLQVAEVFNYAMAEWGETGTAPVDLFEIVIEHAHSINQPNSQQCFGLAYWVLGRKQEAKEHLEKALQAIFPRAHEFSCWRYQELPTEQFLEDVTEMLSHLMEGRAPLPPSVRRAPKAF